MRLKHLMLVSAMAFGTTGFAYASDTAEVNVDLSTSAPSVCYIKSINSDVVPSGVTVTGSTTGGSSVSGSIDFAGTLADPTTAFALASTTSLSVDAYCNFATHQVKLTSLNGGLTASNMTPVVGAFHKRIAYTATLDNWNSLSTVLDTSSADLTDNTPTELNSAPATSAAAVHTVATLEIETSAGTTPLLEGSYADTLKVTFSPVV
jgi:hypothetical protein